MRHIQRVWSAFPVVGFVFAVLFSAVVSANAQGGTTTKNPLVGRWKSDIAVIEIRANGTVKINDDEFVYKVKNSVITVANDDGVMAFPFELDGDTLTVQVDGSEVVYSRIKEGQGPGIGVGSGGGISGGEGSIIQAFVGKWCYLANLGGTSNYRSDRCFTLYANGTYEYFSEVSSSGSAGSSVGSNYDSGRWTATRNSITAYSKTNGKIVYPIELRNHPKTGDPMIVIDGDAYVTQTQKPSW